MKQKQPSGDCYLVAYEHLQKVEDAIARNGLPTRPLALIHGSVVPSTGQESGVQVDHAWVEYGERVLDVSNGNRLDCTKSDYESQFHAVARNRYSPEEATWANTQSGHYGPWETEAEDN